MNENQPNNQPNILVVRLSSLGDIVLSSPILNRSSIKEKETFGLFVNNMLYKFLLLGLKCMIKLRKINSYNS